MLSYLEKLTQDNLQTISNDFKKAQNEGDIRKDMKIEFLMYVMNHLIILAQDDALQNMYDNPQDLVMEITNFLFYGILNREIQK